MPKLLILFFVAWSTLAFSQGLTQSADGKSTIPIRGTTIGLDINKTDLSLGVNNLDKKVQSEKLEFVLGGDLKVKNEEGLANLFSSGDFVPAGNMNFFAGAAWSNAQSKNIGARKELANSYINDSIPHQRKSYEASIKQLINNSKKGIVDTAAQKKVSKELLDSLSATKGKPERFIDKIDKLTSTISDQKKVYDDAKKLATEIAADYKAKRQAHIDRLANLHEEHRKEYFHRFLAYGFGGPSYIGFKQFVKVDSSNLANSFVDKQEAGGTIGIGVNYQYRNVWLGATYSYDQTTNFAQLSKKEYSLKNTTNIAPNSISSEDKITAYSGKYGKVDVNNFNADLVIRMRLDSVKENYLLINPYMRATCFTRDTSLLRW